MQTDLDRVKEWVRIESAKWEESYEKDDSGYSRSYVLAKCGALKDMAKLLGIWVEKD